MGEYGTGRKVGVGFNHDRVLGGTLQFDHERVWETAREMTRLPRPPEMCRPWRRPLAASAVEMHRLLMER
jgi:hypothetical protein